MIEEYPKIKSAFFHEKVESNWSYEYQLFHKLVYLTITQDKFTCTYDIDVIEIGKMTNLVHINDTIVYNKCVFADYFDEQRKIYGDNPIWVKSIPNDKIVTGLSEEFIDLYKKGQGYLCDYKNRENKEPLIDLLISCKYDLIGQDKTGYNSTIIGYDGNIMRHDVYYDYISAGLFSGEYRVKALLEHMKKDPNVINPEIDDVPYYNSDNGNKAIVFGYKIDESLHNELIEKYGYYSNGNHNSTYHIKNLIGVEAFKKDKDED